MSLKSFRSVGWVAGIAATALGCYMVNLKVAAERSSLEEVENRIVIAQRDIRLLQTEIGTRGRLAQLEQWNVKVLALSAPRANQFLEGSFQLATLTAPHKVLDPSAPVVLASAPASAHQAPVVDDDGPVSDPAPATPAVAPAPPPRSTAPADLLHVASLRRELRDTAAAPAPQKAVEKPPVAHSSAAPRAHAPATRVADSGAAPKPPTSATHAKTREAATDR